MYPGLRTTLASSRSGSVRMSKGKNEPICGDEARGRLTEV